MNQELFLERIKFRGIVKKSIDCLKELHRCHMMTVPCEVLDVKFKTDIVLNLDSLFDKIVLMKRGGYCYELNYLFHSLLTHIGFDCHLISAKVYSDFKFGPEYDHLAIVVNLQDEENWLLDVGFGDLFIEPIKIIPDLIQEDQFKTYRIESKDQNNFVLTESFNHKMEFINKYMFNLQPRQIDDFQDQNRFKQYSPKSHFVKNTICTLPTKIGRKTINQGKFKMIQNDLISEREIHGTEDFMNLLINEFNIEL